MKSEMKKPTAPIIKIPIAEIFETVFNSSVVGFLRRCQTLVHCKRNDFSLLVKSMYMKQKIVL